MCILLKALQCMGFNSFSLSGKMLSRLPLITGGFENVYCGNTWVFLLVAIPYWSLP